jgi:hypothetical protein
VVAGADAEARRVIARAGVELRALVLDARAGAQRVPYQPPAWCSTRARTGSRARSRIQRSRGPRRYAAAS